MQFKASKISPTAIAPSWTTFVVVIAVLFAGAMKSFAEGETTNWPMWRGDAARSASTPSALPDALHLRWKRQLETPSPAWPKTQTKLQFDASYEPIVMGKRMFVGSMVSDRMTAYDTDTGDEIWRFYADGPIRFAPVAWKNNLYFVSDDGCLYCLDSETGKQKWAVRGGPDGRLSLGNNRLISAWPARGAPVLWQDAETGKATVYFAASIWPFMGIFIHAVDADTGAIVWTNSGSGSIFIAQQHGSPAFAGVSPQGYFAADDKVLMVSGGRTVPAAYDRKTGEFLQFKLSSRVFEKSAGGYGVTIVGDFYINGGEMYRASNGEPIARGPLIPLGDIAIASAKNGSAVVSLVPDRKETIVKSNLGADEVRATYTLPVKAPLAGDLPLHRYFFSAGGRAYGCAEHGVIGALDLNNNQPALAWSGSIEGEVFSMLPGDGKLFVVSFDGAIYCFSEKETASPAIHNASSPAPISSDSAPGGYAMLWGLGVDALQRVTKLAIEHQVIAIDPDSAKVLALRRSIDEAGLSGRVHALLGVPAELKLPPYLATRIEFGDLSAAGFEHHEKFAESAFHCLRPYGGIAIFTGSAEQIASLKRSALNANLPGAVLNSSGDGSVQLVRAGALPGSASWTHQYADVANTVVSRDLLVKPPLGLLWFGGPSNDDILPRHGHGPTPQVIGGRLFIEGPNALRAVDVYTGRLLWQRAFPGLGIYYNNTNHQPGAAEIGSNYASASDGVYVIHESKCIRVDPATGETLSEFTLPAKPDQPAPHWGYVGIYEDLLIATAMPVVIRVGGDKATTALKAKPKDEDDEDKMDEKIGAGPPGTEHNAKYGSSSEQLVVMDRITGRVLWSRDAQQVFRHNAIAVGAGKIFCIDAISPAKLEALKRRGETPEKPPLLYALDAHTGAVIWQTASGAAATWLGYSAEHDVLLTSGSPSRDRAKDEVGSGMTALQGTDGKRIWHDDFKYSGTPILHGKTIYTDGDAIQLLSGKPLKRENPITCAPADWSFARSYGCNSPIGSEYMLLFRSAAAGYCDLLDNAGTGNWGGFKSGCTSNLIPADGVLVAPDFTRTCTCSYQNQSSIAMVSMPDVETWTFQSYDQIAGRVKRVGINLGAPGDWRGADGTLWLDYPSVGGKGPKIPVKIEGDFHAFRRHAMEMTGAAGQVTASGIEGATSVVVGLQGNDERHFTVRLYFSEPGATAAGERVFDVSLQGKVAAAGLDVFAEAGGQRRGFVKEFHGVSASDALTVSLQPASSSKRPSVLCGIEVVMEP